MQAEWAGLFGHASGGIEGPASLEETSVSTFEVCALFGLGTIAFTLLGVVSAIEKSNRHLSNIADRLRDINTSLHKKG